jgi:hypothetical protein
MQPISICYPVSGVVSPVSPVAKGIIFLLYSKEREIYKHATLFRYVMRYGVQFRGDDPRPGESCSGRGAVACPVLKQGSFEGEGVVVDRGISRRARGSR